MEKHYAEKRSLSIKKTKAVPFVLFREVCVTIEQCYQAREALYRSRRPHVRIVWNNGEGDNMAGTPGCAVFEFIARYCPCPMGASSRLEPLAPYQLGK